jgi:elongator complex protein 2
VIRLYDTMAWNEIKPPLSAHSLTVTRLAFSPSWQDGMTAYLLSVGRDRQWAVFKQAEDQEGEGKGKGWSRVANNLKAHSRMILDATWLVGCQQPSFVTAGRDKTVKVWSRMPDKDPEGDDFTMRASIVRKSPVSAVSATSDGSCSVLAVGEDDGSISLHTIDVGDQMKVLRGLEVPKEFCPSKTINRLAWRPSVLQRNAQSPQLAVASADGSVRILNVSFEELAGE